MRAFFMLVVDEFSGALTGADPAGLTLPVNIELGAAAGPVMVETIITEHPVMVAYFNGDVLDH